MFKILKQLRGKDLRPKELHKKLYPVFKSEQHFQPPSPETFRTQLNRKLAKLTKNEEIERKDIGHQNVSYSILGEGKRRLIALDINLYVSELDKENLEIFFRVIKQIRERSHDPSCYCFTFIGDVPVTFSKTLTAFQSHLDQEKRLYRKHAEEIARIKREVYQVPPGEPKTFWKEEWREKLNERVEKEVGWSIGEYFRKLLKKAEGMDLEERLVLLGVIDKPTNSEEKKNEKDEK